MYTIAMPPLFPYKVTAPDTRYLKRMLIGLLEAFPSYSQDFFLYYLYTKEGVQDHYTISQLAQIVLKRNEKPISDGGIKRNSYGLCEKDSDNESPAVVDKENAQIRANRGKKCAKGSPAGSKLSTSKDVMSIEKSLSYFTPMLARAQAATANCGKTGAQQVAQEIHEEPPGVYVVDRMKANLLKQIEESALAARGDQFLPGLAGHPLLFSSDSRSESLNDEDYEYTQLNTSTMKELSDLDKESQTEAVAKRGAVTERANTETAAQNPAIQPPATERASCMIAQDLYCSENINELFGSRSFDNQ